MQHFEVNYDGLVGPTHNYAGLSFGNVASLANAKASSSPKSAALQGLKKMKALHDMGMKQGVLAPQERPDIFALRRLGFTGTDAEVLHKAATEAPAIFQAVCSASSMWTANAATVSPSADTANGKVHFTPANLTNKFHRSLEPQTSGRILQAMFNNSRYFEHHTHLPDNEHFGDEGAANHTRLCREYGHAGVELFVYGRYAFDSSKPAPKRFPARQTLEASQAIARLHGLSEDNTVYIQQNPDVIDQGVFHNDVIAVGNQNVLFYHEQAFADTEAKLAEIQRKFGDNPLHFIKVGTEQVSIQDAVSTYLFNTQLITPPDGQMTIIAPTECQENDSVRSYLEQLTQNSDSPIKRVEFFDVKQSMRNGGGPACLRLRVALNDEELAGANQNCLMSDKLFSRLNQWVEKHYRDELAVDDLRDPALLEESRSALDELTQILKLGSVYPFQQD
ncbi:MULTISPECIES: N-succinylarginine dihydrolase [Idiomarina]|jgi:succinylarginine dihydrolase|uniref:N-succinylarginine dihydrolase n=1 Tax=Idiomarina TaxID=135575 RepID=UPI0006C8DBD7|nr:MULTISPECIES: N-succinylarginine dihydrolase [Idiomarina]KPD22249.1 N-succinylarginine dihydrolase [Idiomarina abyssalis]MAB22685.1 N-succinylarginine dihydrolase [Idiomarina sp.]MAL82785.1 N-succinylarginine dihydrolase [Idiomarina sp.]MAO67613.1 N-succinylarginine dihydrolase [Idiomarina sp.]MBE92876.1 N-succinylarginine dihydrolase [Idiomarina sp.]|tara:strand:+ start:550 stop:1893 length:1344 start_codon:yes stop_codon:yes gene_type:complete